MPADGGGDTVMDDTVMDDTVMDDTVIGDAVIGDTVIGDMVIVAYRPKPGGADALAALVATHVPELRALGLATARPALAMRAADGTIVEVFEWRAGGIAAAHESAAVRAIWARFAAACDIVPIAAVPEAAAPFSQFAPLAPA